ncbi:MAG: ferredoxin reductase family protein [Candidatus Nanopelagicales bacterium]
MTGGAGYDARYLPQTTGAFLPEVPEPAAAPVADAAHTALLLAPPSGAPVDETLLPPLPPQFAPPPIPAAPVAAPAPVTVRPHVRRGVAARGRSTRRGDIALTIGGIGLGISLGIAVYAVKDNLDLPGGKMLAAGTVAAMVGTYLCLVLLLLVSRIPWLEREIGHDRMVKLHRTVAPYSIFLILAHVLLTTLSYAQSLERGFVAEFLQLVLHSAWMMPAAAAFVLMMSLGVLSYRRIRQRMKYETWWVAHLYFYIAVALAFGHQITNGPMFVAHPYQRLFWIGLYVAVATTILVSRVIMPVSFSRKHDLRVAAVVPEKSGVVSVYVSGVDLDLLKARGGQFFQWRFMTRDWWWQAHPYSLSASPNESWLRITVKDLGDHSSSLRRMKVGTRVLAEGPYGVFHAGSRTTESVVAFAAGVGVTPIRAVLDDLPDGTSVTLIYRVAERATAPLHEELEAMVSERGWRMHYLQGPRRHHPLTAEYLTHLAPGIAAADVFVCGPDSFTESIVEAAEAAGVPQDRIHHEAFAF